MTDIETVTTCEEKFSAISRAGEFELSIDAQKGEGPSPNEVLVADYASCFSFAFRAGAMRNDFEDPGTIQVEAEADLDDEDDLSAIRFVMHVETEYDADDQARLLELAEDICHVHAALRDELHADVDLHTGQEFQTADQSE